MKKIALLFLVCVAAAQSVIAQNIFAYDDQAVNELVGRYISLSFL